MKYSFAQAYRSFPIPILDTTIPLSHYCPLNLSYDNPELEHIAISDPEACQGYIDGVLARNGARVAYGGYLEKRKLYGDSQRFSGGQSRDIHLGLDFWCAAGTTVHCPVDGRVHSFANNSDYGNYGPTIVLQHQYMGKAYYSLYGHLSEESLQGIFPGKVIQQGEVLAALGTTDINVGYAPHLHFQLIFDLEDYKGDYPGVSAVNTLEYYKKNCPDPNLLLRLP